MKIFHTTTYKLYNKDNIKISIISDIHFSYKTNRKLELLLNHLNKIKPNYILIPGDLIDSVDMIEKQDEKDRLINWLKRLSKISKVIISLGNHDYYKIKEKKFLKNKFDYKFDNNFYNEINSIDNIYLLNNDYYSDDVIYIVGITLSYNYYLKEDINILEKDLNENKNIISNLPNNKLKIIMIHSPYNLDNKNILNKLNEFDYFVTGHMHNGCVPPIINELWNSNKGIISPHNKIFSKNTRNSLKKSSDKLIINGPVTTFQACSSYMQIFNCIYPIYNTILEFNKNNNFNIRKRYHK